MTKTLNNRTFIYLIIAISVFLSVMTVGNIHSQLIFAQANSTTSTTNTTSTNTTSGSNPSNSSGVIDSFRANGLISSLASDTIAGTPNANKTEM